MAIPNGYDSFNGVLTGLANTAPTDNRWSITLANAESINLNKTANVNGVYLLTDGANAVALIVITGTTVTLGPSTPSQTTLAVTDAGTAIRFYNSSGTLVIKNSTGGSKTVTLVKIG